MNKLFENLRIIPHLNSKISNMRCTNTKEDVVCRGNRNKTITRKGKTRFRWKNIIFNND